MGRLDPEDVRRAHQIELIVVLAVRTIADLKAPFVVRYRTVDGKQGQVALQGLPLPDIQQKMSEADAPPAQLDYKEDGRIAVLTIRSFARFADKDGKKPIQEFYNEAFADIAKRGSR